MSFFEHPLVVATAAVILGAVLGWVGGVASLRPQLYELRNELRRLTDRLERIVSEMSEQDTELAGFIPLAGRVEVLDERTQSHERRLTRIEALIGKRRVNDG